MISMLDIIGLVILLNIFVGLGFFLRYVYNKVGSFTLSGPVVAGVMIDPEELEKYMKNGEEDGQRTS